MLIHGIKKALQTPSRGNKNKSAARPIRVTCDNGNLRKIYLTVARGNKTTFSVILMRLLQAEGKGSQIKFQRSRKD